MGLTIYLDGEFVPQEKAVVSVFDHGLLYGDGIFEGIRAYNNRVFKLEEHIERFYESAQTLMMELPMSREEMAGVVLETCRRNDLKDAYIRLVATRGVGDLGLDPQSCPKPTVFCIAASIQLYSEDLYTRGLEVVTVPTRRNTPESTNPRIKSLNYLNNIYGKMEAKLAGVPEAIMMNQEGYVAEATGDNIFLVKKGRLITPPIQAGILEGVTRNCVIELAREKGIPVEEKLFTRHDIYIADECFLTGSAAECIPVIKVDGRTIGKGKPGEMTWDLIDGFREKTRTDGPVIFEE